MKRKKRVPRTPTQWAGLSLSFTVLPFICWLMPTIVVSVLSGGDRYALAGSQNASILMMPFVAFVCGNCAVVLGIRAIHQMQSERNDLEIAKDGNDKATQITLHPPSETAPDDLQNLFTSLKVIPQMKSSRNKGKGLAVTGIVIGGFEMLVGAGLLAVLFGWLR